MVPLVLHNSFPSVKKKKIHVPKGKLTLFHTINIILCEKNQEKQLFLHTDALF